MDAGPVGFGRVNMALCAGVLALGEGVGVADGDGDAVAMNGDVAPAGAGTAAMDAMPERAIAARIGQRRPFDLWGCDFGEPRMWRFIWTFLQ
jgi:hypothetical protein